MLVSFSGEVVVLFVYIMEGQFRRTSSSRFFVTLLDEEYVWAFFGGFSCLE